MNDTYLNLDGLARLKENICNLLPVYINNITISSSDWVNKRIILHCPVIKVDSIINIYYSESSKALVESLNLSYTQGDTFIQIIAENDVLADIYIDVIEIINPKSYLTVDKSNL